MTKLLTDAEVARYRRDGFLAPVRLISAGEAAALRRELEAAEARWPAALSAEYRNNAHLVLPFVDAIAHHDKILDAVEDLIGPDILVYGSVLFIKDRESAGFVSWHQDGTYMGLQPHEGVTVWLALSPSNRVSGCMRMIPGSHEGEIRTHSDSFAAANILTRGQEIAAVAEEKAVDIPLEPGEVSFHHLRVIHGSEPNRGADRRIGIAIQCYITPEMRQVKGPGFAQLGRGRDRFEHFEILPRPRSDMDPADAATRDKVNAAWSDILYQGAARKRNY